MKHRITILVEMTVDVCGPVEIDYEKRKLSELSIAGRLPFRKKNYIPLHVYHERVY